MIALGEVLLRRGNWAEAQQWYEKALALAQTLGSRTALAAVLVGYGEIAVRRGARAHAAEQLGQARAICREIGLGRYQHRAESLLAQLDDGTAQHADAS